MRVLYIISNPSLNLSRNTGYARHIRETVKGLEVNGHDVYVFQTSDFVDTPASNFTFSGTNSSSTKEVIRSIIPKFLWQSFKDLILLVRLRKAEVKLRKLLLSRRFDAVIERASYLSSIGISVNHQLNVPFLIELNAPLVEEQKALNGSSLLNPLAERIERRMYLKASAVLTVSGALAEYVHDLNVPKEKVIVNHNGVSEEDFQVIESECQGRTIGFVGSIMPYHGIDVLLRASLVLHRDGVEHNVLVVGDGEGLKQYQSMSESLGINQIVKFTGGVPYKEIPALIALMDVCVLPSTEWYCSPIKLFEYGLMAKAVVASNHDCVSEIIKDGETGLLVSDVNEMSEAMLCLLEDSEKRQKLGRAFRKEILRTFLWRHNGQRLDRVLTRVVASQT